ncbi:MAG: small ribosomal subunit Rsm22 family protein [Spirochaetaceae bacterium]|jgi:ribosomal protein RSM22 (predicted rRNA methylase)|nr:small ribosomal subunit Rsm22 family protein [Spirochaetaceae bacterium]
MTSEPLFPPLKAPTAEALNRLCAAIERVFPVPDHFVRAIPADIALLSRLLTSERSQRRDGYLTNPRFLSAYTRYFLPWNVFRLTRLFSSSAVSSELHAVLHEGATIIDLGSGPLSLPLALWTAFPELQNYAFTLYAVDAARKALAAGKRLFANTAGTDTPWHIITRQGRFGALCDIPPADLVTAVYMINEVTAAIPQADTAALSARAHQFAVQLIRLCAREGAILVVEPGIPRSAQFISMLKSAFEMQGFYAALPCPPESTCCMRGGKRGAKWCHFSFGTEDAPPALHEVSWRAHLPKEKAVLSFLLVRRTAARRHTSGHAIRVISDPFPLHGGCIGRYACSQAGMILLRGADALVQLGSGTQILCDEHRFAGKDPKSGALIMDFPA